MIELNTKSCLDKNVLDNVCADAFGNVNKNVIFIVSYNVWKNVLTNVEENIWNNLTYKALYDVGINLENHTKLK